MADRTSYPAHRSKDPRGRAALRACMLLGLAACGRWGFSQMPGADGATAGDDAAVAIDAPEGMLDAMPDAMIDAPAVRSVTMVNGLSALPAGKLDLGVTGTPSGFTVAFVSANGGDMDGVNLDAAMRPDADWRSTSSTNSYVATSMTWTGFPMTTMTRSDDFTYIKRYEPDLSSYTEMAGMAGVGTKPTYATVGGRWFYAIACDVLRLSEIATDGVGIGNPIDVPGDGSAEVRAGGALGGEGSTLYAVWFHASGTCQWVITSVGATITPTSGAVAGTCVAPRLAVEPGRAVAVMDDGVSILKMTLDAGGTASAPAMIATGIAPRIERAAAGGFWLAWQVGGELHVATYALGGNPENELKVDVPGAVQAYELVASGGHTYLFVAANRQLWWAKLD